MDALTFTSGIVVVCVVIFVLACIAMGIKGFQARGCGSEKIRQWIENYKPFLVVTGHIHESAGIDYIGKTPIINPGALCEGKYATVEVQWDEKVLDKVPEIISIELKSL